MPLFMDIHKHIPGLTAEAVKGAHAKDLEVQKKHGVEYLKYWYDEGSGKVFCLAKAPNKEAAMAVHREAHGLVADEIIEVKEGTGERSPAVFLHLTDRLEELLPNTKRVEISRASHIMHEENASVYNEAVLAFLRTVSGRTILTNFK